MTFVPTSIKSAFSSLLLLVLQADSVSLSAEAVNYHFNKDHSYLYQAANFGNATASMQLFQQDNKPKWLHQAAKQGDTQAAFLWYQQDPEQHQVWLEFSANNGYVPAILSQLDLLVTKSEWQVAKDKLVHYQQTVEVDQSYQARFTQLEQVIDLGLLPPERVEPVVVNSLLENKLDYQCRIKVQPYIVKEEYRIQLKTFAQTFDSSLMQGLPVCFNQAVHLPEIQSICQQDRQGRIDCDLKKLAMVSHQTQQQQNFSHILVMVDEGEANTRGGLMFLDKDDTSMVFLHELGHWFGFVDEYRIGRTQQRQLCQVEDYGFLGINLFVTRKGITKKQAEQYADRKLYKADTCNGSEFQAYKFSPEPSFMLYLKASISPFYQSLLLDSINYSRIVPAAMNFAHVYKDDYELYLSYIKDAASTGYQGAITEFSQHLVEQGSYLEAKNLLEFGAENGGINSQLLLGHAYLEGSWLPRDLTESALWYKKAAEQNDGYGLYFYGKCLEMGWGCIQSQEQAYEYYRRSAQVGNKLAKQKLVSFAPN